MRPKSAKKSSETNFQKFWPVLQLDLELKNSLRLNLEVLGPSLENSFEINISENFDPEKRFETNSENFDSEN